MSCFLYAHASIEPFHTFSLVCVESLIRLFLPIYKKGCLSLPPTMSSKRLIKFRVLDGSPAQHHKEALLQVCTPSLAGWFLTAKFAATAETWNMAQRLLPLSAYALNFCTICHDHNIPYLPIRPIQNHNSTSHLYKYLSIYPVTTWKQTFRTCFFHGIPILFPFLVAPYH